MNNVNFIDVNFDTEQNMKEIVILFKELINQICKLNKIVNINISSHMIDQFRIFNEIFISIKRCTIKIEKEVLHINQYKTTIIKVKNNEYRLSNIIYF